MIIGLCGFTGAGKTTVAEIIKNNFKNVQIVSTGAVIRKMLDSLGYERTPENLQKVNDLVVQERGDNYISIVFDDIISESKVVVVDSLRRLVDLTYIKTKYDRSLLLSIDCDPKTRFDRLVRRRRLADPIDMKAFQTLSLLERNWGVDQLKLRADICLQNECSMAELECIVVSELSSKIC